jgi:hypothetical protein
MMADTTKPPHHSERADDDEQSVPASIDPTIPSPARMYDYYLGGKDNYAADREAAEKALSVAPSGRRTARANRYFLMRAVVQMADQGVCQFIDLGTGIPTSPSVHELARAIQSDARVLYVDNDAVVTVHNRALLVKDENVRALQADIRDPETILSSPELRELIDFNQPVGVLFVAVLHFVRDQEDPQGIIRAFTNRMVPGSYLALSHITSDGTAPGAVATIQEVYEQATAPAVFRTEAEIRIFFSDLEMVPPGLTDVTRWTPHTAVFTARPPDLRFLAGLGRKAGAEGKPAPMTRVLTDRY